MFSLIPKEDAFFDMFKKAAHNMIEGSRLLKEMMEQFRDSAAQARQIKDVEHVGDGITHDIATKLNQTFITPIDREDIHDLASALDDILDAVEAVRCRLAIAAGRTATGASSEGPDGAERAYVPGQREQNIYRRHC